MPTSVELISDPVSLSVPALYGALICWEAAARRLRVVKYWKLQGTLAFMFYFLLSSYLPLLWPEQLATFRLFESCPKTYRTIARVRVMMTGRLLLSSSSPTPTEVRLLKPDTPALSPK